MFTRIASALLIAAVATTASAAGPKIAVVAPADGNLRILGDQLRLGAAFAARDKAEIVEITETCAEGSGPALAEEIARSAAVAAIGFLCTESLQDGLARLAAADIPAITLSIRSEVLMQDALKNGWPFFRMAPSTSDERDAVADAIFTHWKDKPFALLDDGTILSREMTDMVRQTLEQKGMSAAFVDNFRPAQEVQTQLIRRLVKANVTHVFAASDRNDMSVLARDARATGAKITLLGGDALKGMNQPVPLEIGVQAITLPDPSTLASARSAIDLMLEEKKIPDGYALPAFSAIEVVVDASEIAAGSGARLVEALVDTPFDTAIGPIRFGADHELADNPYRLLVWDGDAFVEPKVTP
ncbi:MAG: branched-chain amino acid ABC transporter substrate-binding protein [Rhizobium sp.]|nr:branched-chain amino acid ABC transporter substrate-binding protein [Rhizobium sp.]